MFNFESTIFLNLNLLIILGYGNESKYIFNGYPKNSD